MIDANSLIRRRMLLNTLSNFLGKGANLGVWFFLTPYLLRRLGAETYGLWAVVGSIVAYGALLDLGITSAVAKYVAEYRARGEVAAASRLVATTLWLYTGLGLLAVALAALLAPVLPSVLQISPEQRTTAFWLVLVSGLGVGVSLPASVSVAVLRGLQRFDLMNLISLAGTALFTLAVVGALSLGWGVVGLAAANVPVTLIMQVPAIWLVYRAAPELRFGWRGASRGLVRTVASFSSALFVINLSGQIQTKTDELVIGAWLPVASVAPYSIARRLSELPQILTEQFMKVLMPLASQLHAQEDRGRLQTLFLASTRLTLASLVPQAIGLALLARPFLTWWVGPAYGGAATLVLILSAATVFDTLQWPASSILQGMARHRRLAVLAFGTALANLGISVVLVRRIGVTGVALGTLIPAAVESLCLTLPYALRVNRVSVRTALAQVVLPVLAPAAPMALVVYGLRQLLQPASLVAILGIAVIGCLAYAPGYLAFKASAVERQALLQSGEEVLRTARGQLRRLGLGAEH